MKDKRYIILGQDRNGKWHGWVEHSFCMGSSETEVRVWAPKYKRSGGDNQHDYNWLRMTAERLTKERWEGMTWRVYRVGSKYCPVKVDFTAADQMKSGKRKYDKYWWRNQRFETITPALASIEQLKKKLATF